MISSQWKQFVIIVVLLFNPKHIKWQIWLSEYPLLKGCEMNIMFNLHMIDSLPHSVLVIEKCEVQNIKLVSKAFLDDLQVTTNAMEKFSKSVRFWTDFGHRDFGLNSFSCT